MSDWQRNKRTLQRLMSMTIFDWYSECDPMALLGQLSDEQKANIQVTSDVHVFGAELDSTLRFACRMHTPPNKLLPDGNLILVPATSAQGACNYIREFAIPSHAHCRCDPDVGVAPCEWCEVSEPWFRGEVRAMAASIIKNRDFRCTDLLADRLEERGCDYELLLQHLRGKIPCTAKFCTARSKIVNIFGTVLPCPCDQGWVTKSTDCMEFCWALWLILGNTQKLYPETGAY